MANQQLKYIEPAIQIEVVWHPDFLAGEEFAKILFKALASGVDYNINGYSSR